MKLRELLFLNPYFEKKQLMGETEFLPTEELEKLQKVYIYKLLKHSVKNISFYQKHADVGIVQSDKDSFELIRKFPIIDKTIVRKQIDQFVCGTKLRYLKASTGGSTGQPFAFYMDRFRTRQEEKAFIFDMWSRVGYQFGDPIFNLRGRTPKKNKFIHHDRFFNIFFASSFNLKSTTIARYVDEINKIQPRFLHGYPSTMYQLASLMEQACLKLEMSPKAVFCGSEKLFPYQRELIEEVFSSRVYSWYGHSECLVLGGECEHSHSLHIYPQYGYVELFPTGTKNAQGKEIHEIIATGFNNYVMPLIRFRTGDYAVLADDQTCRCSRNYLLLDEVIGREQEFIVDVQGDLISATSLIFGQHFSVFSGLDGLYLQQNVPGELIIFMKKNAGFVDDDLMKMKSQIEHLVGNRFSVNYDFTDELPKSKMGKARLVQQQIDISQYIKTGSSQ